MSDTRIPSYFDRQPIYAPPPPGSSLPAPEFYLKSVQKHYPAVWQELRKTADECAGKIPAWDLLPYENAYQAMADRLTQEGRNTTGDPRAYYWLLTLAPLYKWRVGKGIYRFAPEVYDALIRQPFDGDVPIEPFFRLPEWACYIETPNYISADTPQRGFIVTPEYNLRLKRPELIILSFCASAPFARLLTLPLVGGTLMDAIQTTRRESKEAREAEGLLVEEPPLRATLALFTRLLNLTLYLCADNGDRPYIEHPRTRASSSSTTNTPKAPRVWPIGMRIGATIRKYENENAQAPESSQDLSVEEAKRPRASVRPHLRRAHWHHYWTGAKSDPAARKLILHWIPPVPVGVESDDNPTVLHLVNPSET